jgi:hypothetical protein
VLEELGYAQKKRLAYIDFCLLFKDVIYRQDLINRFEVGLSAGSRYFIIYKELAADNLVYSSRESDTFRQIISNLCLNMMQKCNVLRFGNAEFEENQTESNRLM